jgi:hypothetical protein
MIMWQLRNTNRAPDYSNYSFVLNYIKSCNNVEERVKTLLLRLSVNKYFPLFCFFASFYPLNFLTSMLNAKRMDQFFYESFESSRKRWRFRKTAGVSVKTLTLIKPRGNSSFPVVSCGVMVSLSPSLFLAPVQYCMRP